MGQAHVSWLDSLGKDDRQCPEEVAVPVAREALDLGRVAYLDRPRTPPQVTYTPLCESTTS